MRERELREITCEEDLESVCSGPRNKLSSERSLATCFFLLDRSHPHL